MPPSPFTVRPSAFTADGTGRVSEVITPVGLSLPLLPNEVPPSDIPRSYRALWDTGATASAVTKETVNKLGLPAIGRTMVHHADGATEQDVYLLSVYLPNNFIIPMVRATECKEIAGRFDFIIGMDIITLGDLAITNVSGKTTISFRMPPDRKIDYVAEIEEMNVRASRKNLRSKIGRNDPCPCGSGKKYKNCHGV